jgi:hypothetical protein
MDSLKSCNYEFDATKFPKLFGWMNAMRSLEPVKSVANSTEAYIHFYEGYMQGKIDYDFEL